MINKQNSIIHTFGIANAGAIGKSIGSVAPSWNATILAKGFKLNLFTILSLVNTKAAAPSFIDEAFPAVTVPFSFYKNNYCLIYQEVIMYINILKINLLEKLY